MARPSVTRPIGRLTTWRRVDHLTAGDILRFDGRDWLVIEVVLVHGDSPVGVVVIARGTVRPARVATRRALPFPHPSAAAEVVIV